MLLCSSLHSPSVRGTDNFETVKTCFGNQAILALTRALDPLALRPSLLAGLPLSVRLIFYPVPIIYPGLKPLFSFSYSC